MRDRYVGDIGDFAKYGLLRYLTGITAADGGPRLSLGVIWYARTEQGTTYLHNAQDFQSLDCELFDNLCDLVNARTLTRVEEVGVLGKNTKYWDCPIPSAISNRKTWFNRALKHVSGCGVVFLDPDKGLHSAQSMSDETKTSTERAYFDEVIKAEKNAKAVVLYHSFGREGNHPAQINKKITEIREKFRDSQGVFAVRWNTSIPRAFLIICKASQRSLVRKRLQNMVTTWGKGRSKNSHFTLYTK